MDKILSIVVFFPLLSLGAVTLYRDAAIVTMAQGSEVFERGWFSVCEDGYIVDLRSGAPTEDDLATASEVVELDGKIVMPGFLSGHSHLWQSAFRGIAPDGELWEWLNALHWTYGDDFTEGDLGAFTAHGAWDQLCHGITTTYNHSHWLDHGEAIFMEQFEAQKKVPQRFIFSSCVNFDEPPERWHKMIEAMKAQVEHKPTANLLGVGLNFRQYGPPEVIEAQVEMAEALDLDYQLHYLEQSARQEKERASWPKLMETGVPSERSTFAHFIHPDETIVTEAASVGAGMIWNPLSNGRLGSGLPEIEDYLEAGLKVGMGVDGQASADISDPFENMRMGLYATRMEQEHSDGLQPDDMLRLHTIDTAKTLGVDEFVGSLETGKFADFIVVDTASPMTGPVWDIAAHLVFACSSKNIESVYVGGQRIVSHGAPLSFDLSALSAEVDDRIEALQERHLKDDS